MKKYLIVIMITFLLLGCGINKDDSNKEYYYEAVMNDNMINYTVKIIDGDKLNGNFYSNDGEWLSELKNGEAIVNEMDLKDYPNFKIKIDDKTYEIKKK